MTKKAPALCFAILACLATGYSFYRDLRFEKDWLSDFRNRIVGARLIKDGKTPYFYKWKKEDGVRYYDPQNFDSLQVSNITATPFFHQLLYPLAEKPESELSGWWLGIEYLLWASMGLLACLLARTDTQKMLALAFAVAFLFTDAWKQHVMNGQNYLFIPFLSLLFFFLLQKTKGASGALLAGLTAAVLVLIRPNGLLFFLPFLFAPFRLLPFSFGKADRDRKTNSRNETDTGISRKSRSYRVLLWMPLIVLGTWSAADPGERALWQEYSRSIGEQIRLHQDLGPAIRSDAEKDPAFSSWEGMHFSDQQRFRYDPPVKVYSENGNFFVLFKNIFHRKLPVYALAILSWAVILGLLFLYYRPRPALRGKKPSKPPPAPGKASPAAVNHGHAQGQAALFGYCLYMVSDLFSPIHRHQYYTVQVLFLLLIAATLYRRAARGLFFLMGLGLLMNISRIGFLKMEHTLGEYLILVCALLVAMAGRRVSPADQRPPGELSLLNKNAS